MHHFKYIKTSFNQYLLENVTHPNFSDALKDVESTTNALEYCIDNSIIKKADLKSIANQFDEVKDPNINGFNKQIGKGWKNATKEQISRLQYSYWISVCTERAIAEAYHKAKADGSNPELVKAVEQLLGAKESKAIPLPTEVKSKAITEPTKQERVAAPLNDNFFKWFGKSKASKNNKPIILFHGTKTNFDIFKPSKSIGNQGETDQLEGMYFTDNKEAASFFALNYDDRFIKSVYLSLQNPYIVESNNELKSKLGITKLADANKKLKELGYDGIIMKNGFYAKGGPFTLYLAFYPNQIKSINNDGTWDINDNNINS